MNILRKLENMLLVFLLSRMSTKGMDVNVFTEIARKIVLTTVNLIVLRRNQGVLQVLLIERPTNDPCWPGKLHVPGTVIREDDRVGNPIGAGDPMQRLIRGELGAQLKAAPVYIGDFPVPSSDRGAEISRVFWAEMVGEPPRGRFFDIAELPYIESLIQEEIPWIIGAIEAYRDNE